MLGDSLKVKLFEEEGFERKICRNCGAPFWTLDPDREFCGDQPCVDYEFIGSPTGVKAESIKSVREEFLRFFEDNGHTRIKRYPIVARWRDDVYLVGASIYDFQPWVTEGIVPPPANPLTISQPCIRLTDVDNVGKTGRHLTSFEMMAHHAFNIDREVYWMDETVDYAYRFLTERMGIPPREITFKEDWWCGGGNAGEDFEVLVRGLEVATLVFMHYRDLDGEIVPMKNRIVDTGYGLERIYWLTKGAPTVYDVVFPELVDKLRTAAGLDRLDPVLIAEVSKIAGKIDAKRPGALKRIRQLAATRLGFTVSEIEAILDPYERIYALLDHTRSIMFMLGDGVVPSNSGAGYLARLLIRRCIRHLMRLGMDIGLVDIVDMQIFRWRDDFPEYIDLRDEILDMVSVEEKKYYATIKEGKKAVKRVVNRVRREGRSQLSIDELMLLYDSHGLPPDLVKEMVEPENVEVEVPADFYSRLAELHEKRRRGKDGAASRIPVEINDLAPTKLLYYEDPRRVEFEAQVVGVYQDKYLVLDATCFYPEGGGQPSDTGIVTDGVNRAKVLKVEKVGNVVVHICDVCPYKPGQRVKGVVDWERRMALMRSHTATHIVLGAARRVLGRHVWQAGAQKGIYRNRLDITHYKRITREELKKIERLANMVVVENRPVKAVFMPRNKAEAKYGFGLYQGGIVPGPTIRVVEIEGWDAEACGGLHVSRTGEVGMIKIVGVDRIQDGVERLEFTSGLATLKYLEELEDRLAAIANLVEGDMDNVVKQVEKISSENTRLRYTVKRLITEHVRIHAENLLESCLKVGNVKLVVAALSEEPNVITDVAIAVIRKDPETVVVLVSDEEKPYIIVMLGENVVKLGLDARIVGRAITERFGGKGGGKNDMFRGRLNRHMGEKELAEIRIFLSENILSFIQ